MISYILCEVLILRAITLETRALLCYVYTFTFIYLFNTFPLSCAGFDPRLIKAHVTVTPLSVYLMPGGEGWF